MIHIGISGPIASGKSTLSQQLVEYFDSAIVPLAYGLKHIANMEFVDNRLNAMTEQFIEYGAGSINAYIAASMVDGYMQKYPSTPGVKNRRLLQFIGTEVGRDTLGADFWINVTLAAVADQSIDVLISDDVRFDNEAATVDLHVHIDTTNNPCYQERIASLGSEYMYAQHASERGLTATPDIIIPACWNKDDLADIIAIVTLALE